MNSAWTSVFAKPPAKPVVKPVVKTEKPFRYMLDVPMSERSDAWELGARYNYNTGGYMIYSNNYNMSECVDRWNGYKWD
jgi:hypothetical protein